MKELYDICQIPFCYSHWHTLTRAWNISLLFSIYPFIPFLQVVPFKHQHHWWRSNGLMFDCFMNGFFVYLLCFMCHLWQRKWNTSTIFEFFMNDKGFFYVFMYLICFKKEHLLHLFIVELISYQLKSSHHMLFVFPRKKYTAKYPTTLSEKINSQNASVWQWEDNINSDLII